MLLRILCVHIETSSIWAVFVNKNRYISVSLESEEDKSSTLQYEKCMHLSNNYLYIIMHKFMFPTLKHSTWKSPVFSCNHEQTDLILLYNNLTAPVWKELVKKVRIIVKTCFITCYTSDWSPLWETKSTP